MSCLARYRAYARAVIPLVFVALSAAVNASVAQGADEQAAYAALIYTPVAGLPPLPPITDSLGRNGGSGVSLLGRLGHMSRGGGSLSLNAFGVGVEVPRGRMRLGATLAISRPAATWSGRETTTARVTS